MTEPQSRAPDAIARTSGDRADEVIGRALSESASLRTVLEAMDDYSGSWDYDTQRQNFDLACDFCDARIAEAEIRAALTHDPDCPVRLARRLLGKE